MLRDQTPNGVETRTAKANSIDPDVRFIVLFGKSNLFAVVRIGRTSIRSWCINLRNTNLENRVESCIFVFSRPKEPSPKDFLLRERCFCRRMSSRIQVFSKKGATKRCPRKKSKGKLSSRI